MTQAQSSAKEELFRVHYTWHDRKFLNSLFISDVIFDGSPTPCREPIIETTFLTEKFVSKMEKSAIAEGLFELDAMMMEVHSEAKQLFRMQYMDTLRILNEKCQSLVRQNGDFTYQFVKDVAATLEKELFVQQERFNAAPWRLVDTREYESFVKQLPDRFVEKIYSRRPTSKPRIFDEK